MVRGDWNQMAVEELSLFPSAAHDDIVDGLSGAYAMLTDVGGELRSVEIPYERG